jgi:hypothetical protein
MTKKNNTKEEAVVISPSVGDANTTHLDQSTASNINQNTPTTDVKEDSVPLPTHQQADQHTPRDENSEQSMVQPELPVQHDPAPMQPSSRSVSSDQAPIAPAEAPVQNDDSTENSWQLEEFENQRQEATTPEDYQVEALYEWKAQEFIAHAKTRMWYIRFTGVSLLILGLTYFLSGGDKIVTFVTATAAVSVGIFASRKPRELDYSITTNGVTIADKHYPYSSFKSFSIQKEGVADSIFLMPMKRYQPGLSLYYSIDKEEQIVKGLKNFLPHEDRPPDAVDKLMSKVRF